MVFINKAKFCMAFYLFFKLILFQILEQVDSSKLEAFRTSMSLSSVIHYNNHTVDPKQHRFELQALDSLIHIFFSTVNTTILQAPCLVESTDIEGPLKQRNMVLGELTINYMHIFHWADSWCPLPPMLFKSQLDLCGVFTVGLSFFQAL